MAIMFVFDENRCIRCFKCVDECEAEALEIRGLYEIPYWNQNKCTECMRCVKICEKGAIEVKTEES